MADKKKQNRAKTGVEDLFQAYEDINKPIVIDSDYKSKCSSIEQIDENYEG